MKTIEQRINNIQGQLNGIKKMSCDKDRSCFSMVVQLKAVKSAVSSLMDKVISEELSYCLPDKKGDREKLEVLFKEIIKK